MKHKKVYDEKGRLLPVRMCVACREYKPLCELVTVRLEDGVAKLGGKTGRGAHICRSKECAEKAQKIRGIERGLKAPVSESLYKELTELVNNK